MPMVGVRSSRECGQTLGNPPTHMARIPRIDLPGIAQHIVQRGNDRQAGFADDADYLHYRQNCAKPH